jgi:outer membrane receptor protein involved in Fe transport
MNPIATSRRPVKGRLCLAISAAMGFGAIYSAPLTAQNDSLEAEYEPILEEVIVTGSRIVTEDGFGRSSPVTVIGMEEIASFGLTRIEDILNNLPQIETAQTAFQSFDATGTAQINLRGLGPKRTLVLVNGRRMQPGGIYTWAVDVNQIPAQMIERVEVLTGGASAVYGADAVAGVVNFIMRRVDGVELSFGIDGYQHDNRNDYIQGLLDERGWEYPTGNTGIDGEGYNLNFVIGGDFLDGRGNATAYVNWRKDTELRQGSRDYSSCALNRSATDCGGSLTAAVPNFWIAPLVEGGWGPYGYDYWQEEFLELQPDSSLAPLDWWNSTNKYNFAPINFYRRPDERWSFGAFADFEINEHAVAYLETMSASDETRAEIAESGIFPLDVYPLQLDNAYFPDNFRQSLMELWPGEDEFGVYIAKRNVEGGPRTNVLEHNGFRIVTGVKGILAGDWDYDVSYLHAQTSSSTTYINDFLKPRIAQAIDAALCEADPACIPYLVFTYQGVTPEAANSLEGTAVATSNTDMDVFRAYVTGDSGWGLPAGNIMTAAGYERRKVSYERIADEVYEQSALTGGGDRTQSLGGGYSVDELFFEAKIPLLADRRLSRDMVLDLAYRWSDYSTSGANSTYRLGLDWQIVDWLRLRTGYNRAVRTPNIGELYTPQKIGGFWGTDLCEGPEPVYTFEQCARSGVTAEQYGNIIAAPEDLPLQALWGGNPDLDPEEADTFTLGLVFEAGFDMRFSLDYWDIQIDGVIENMDPWVALEQCALDGQLCEAIQRGQGGLLWRGEDAYVHQIAWNLGSQHFTGIDNAWSWSPAEHWLLDLIGTWYLKKETTYIPNDPDSSYDCVGRIAQQQCFPTPEWRHIASATYDSGSFWAVTGRWRYFGAISYDGDDDDIPSDVIDAQNYLDLNAVFRFMGTHDFTLGVNNVLDEEPPLVGGWMSTNGNTIAGFYDTLGRYLYARVTLRW